MNNPNPRSNGYLMLSLRWSMTQQPLHADPVDLRAAPVYNLRLLTDGITVQKDVPPQVSLPPLKQRNQSSLATGDTP
ncbi:hypothetical protein [Novipirellula artificiosorum]|nr:hypothetical protein [Novipirellula artificiosorum]